MSITGLRISELTAAAAPLLTHEFVVNEGGANRKLTGQQIQDLISGNVVLWESALGVTKLKTAEPIDLQSEKIENVEQGTLLTDATNKEQTKIKHGFVNRTDSNAPSVTGDILSIAPVTTSFDVFVNGVKFTKSAALTIDLTSYAIGDLIYVSIDDNGDIQASTTAWHFSDLTKIPAALAFKHSLGYIITDERHNSTRNLEWHEWSHLNVGAMYNSGLAGSFEEGLDSLQFEIASGVIYDEDIRANITTQNTTTHWYRDGVSSMKVRVGSSYTFADTNDDGTGLLQWDDGSGTLATVDNQNYATNWIFATNDPDNPIYTVISQGNYNTITAARNATFPVINLSTAEWKLLYRVIYKRAGTAIEFEEVADFRTVQTGVPTSPIQPNSHDQLINRDAANSHPASAISVDISGFTGNLAAIDPANVQIALAAIDAFDLAHSIYNQTDATPLTQRENLRIEGYLTAVDDAVEEETVVDIDPALIEEVEFSDQTIQENTNEHIDEGTGATGDDNSITTDKTLVTDEFAGKWAILHYPLAAGEYELVKVLSNNNTTDASVITFTTNRQYTGITTGIDWYIIEPFTFLGENIPSIVHDLSAWHGVILLPAIESVNNGYEADIITLKNTEANVLYIISEDDDVVEAAEDRILISQSGRSVRLKQFAKTGAFTWLKTNDYTIT